MIPAAIREAAGLKPGSRAIVTLAEDGIVETRTVAASHKRAWKPARKHKLNEKPLVEDLLAQRKAAPSRRRGRPSPVDLSPRHRLAQPARAAHD